jgi:hypothetical protein
MAMAAIDRVRDADVRALATRMARNQRIEIHEYEAVRTRLGLPLPADLHSVPVPAAGSNGSGTHQH